MLCSTAPCKRIYRHFRIAPNFSERAITTEDKSHVNYCGTQRLRLQQAAARRDGAILHGPGPRPGRREKDRLVYECRPGRVAAGAGIQRLFPRKPRRHAGGLADGHGPDPLGQRPRFLAGYLLVSHKRRGIVPQGREPPAEDEIIRPAQGRRARVQHQPMPGREGLVPVLRPRVERALPGNPHAARDRRGRRSVDRIRRRPDRGPDRAAWNKWPGASSTSTACGK